MPAPAAAACLVISIEKRDQRSRFQHRNNWNSKLPRRRPQTCLASSQRLVARSFFDTIPFPKMRTNMKTLLSREQIADGVARIGQEITRDFAGQSVILVGVLKGACLFLSDLARQIELD